MKISITIEEILKSFIAVILMTLLTSCSVKSQNTNNKIFTATELYSLGIQELESKEYSKASRMFRNVYSKHLQSSLAPEATLMHAYSLYLSAKYNEVDNIINMFLQLYPRHRDVIYAFYLKSLAHYVQISDVTLDQSKTLDAKKAFKQLIIRYPNSKYAIDASLKLDLVNDHLAGQEMSIGRYYLKKDNPIAALLRFQRVIKEYETTAHIVEALYRLVEINSILGLSNESKKYMEVLKYNYPDSKWTAFSTNLLK